MSNLLKLTRSYDEVGNIRTFVFETGGLEWQAGQYQYYILPKIVGEDGEKGRFFTISSAPSEHEIHISTRVTDSKFKQALNNLQPGDTIERKDIEGDFTWEDESDKRVVLVAAGIGSTPYRSMLLERHATGKPLSATLLYYSRDNDIAFRNELDELVEQHPELTVSYIIGQSVTADSIMQNAPEYKNQTVYISGPEPMVDSIGEDLKASGVDLKQDWFPGYDESSF